MDTAAADECRRCYAKIGDWATEEGQAQGTECLATYEPNFAEMCGEKMQAFAVSVFLISFSFPLLKIGTSQNLGKPQC